MDLETGCKKWLWGLGGAAWYLLCQQLHARRCLAPWVSLFLLSRALLSAGVDKDELQQPPQCFASRSCGT